MGDTVTILSQAIPASPVAHARSPTHSAHPCTAPISLYRRARPAPSRRVIGGTGRAAASISGYEPLCAPLEADGLGLGVGEGVAEPSSCWAASARARASRRRV